MTDPAPSPQRDYLETHLHQIAQERDPYWSPQNHGQIQAYIRQQLQQWGHVIPHEFNFRGQIHQNLILNLPGRGSSTLRDPIMIGAHYDAVPGTPGADDNASGVAVLLELARSIAAAPVPRPIQIVAFDLEEYGMLGSQAYAADLKQQGQKLRLMISLEMLGYRDPAPGSQRYPDGLQRFYPDQGDFIALIGNVFTIPDLIRMSGRIKQAGVACEWLPAGLRGVIVPATRLSDHSPFWDQGYRALMVTDTAFLRNPHYHQLTDRIDTIDLDFMTHVAQGLLNALQHL